MADEDRLEHRPKRIQFIVISIFKPCDSGFDDKRRKRVKETKEGDRDVDYLYLQDNFINEYKDAGLKVHQNVRADALLDELSKMDADESLKNFDCFIFVFLTFFSEGGVNNEPEALHLFDKKMSLDELWEKVGEIRPMQNKHKVFLVQADDVGMFLDPPTILKGGDSFKGKKIPTDADRLTIISTIPAKIFQRGEDEPEPSLLIQAFVEEVNANRNSESPLDLLSLTTTINRNVLSLIEVSTLVEKKYQIEKSSLPVPCTTSTFRQPLKL